MSTAVLFCAGEVGMLKFHAALVEVVPMLTVRNLRKQSV